MKNDIKNKVLNNKLKHSLTHSIKLELILFLIGIIFYIIALFLKNNSYVFTFSLLSLVLCGNHVIPEGFIETVKQSKQHKKFMPNIHLLMAIADIWDFFLGEYKEATLLIIIFGGENMLEEYAESKSKKEIKNLLKLNPTTARLVQSDGSIKIVDVSTLNIGDKLLVLNGDQIATDGVVISGNSWVDESSITGESLPKEVSSGDNVFGSTINGNGTLQMQVTKNSNETVFAKIVQLVSQTQNNISKTAAFIKKFEPKYVTVVLALAPLFYLLGTYVFGWGVQDSFYKTMVFLIVSSPCALAATDIPATLSAISNLAKKGVLFKGGSYLSNLSDVKAVAFDKTGTLTQGKPQVTDVYFINGLQKSEINNYKKIIVSMESKSNHPLASAILQHFGSVKPLNIQTQNNIGVGLSTTHKGVDYLLAKPSVIKNIEPEIENIKTTFEDTGKTAIIFSVNQKVVAIIAVLDTPKESSKQAIKYFKDYNIKTIMITGDAKKTGHAIATQLDIDQVYTNVLPQEKAGIITDLKNKYKVVAMVGDGVNDAPALVNADIGIAMGEGTDIAIDAADAVLMKNDLTKLTYTHQVSKKLRRIVWQNIIFSMSVVLFLNIINILGFMNMTFAVVVHEGSTLLVVLNGLRLLKQLK